MTPTVTISRIRHATGPRSWRNPSRAVVYVESNVVKLVDELFNKHEVYSLPSKSRAWSTLGNKATRQVSAELKDFFKAKEVKFSRKAGCSCGCSPGYIVMDSPDLYRKEAWVNITSDDTVVRAACAKFPTALAAERLTHSS
jgi:hypothetical protein